MKRQLFVIILMVLSLMSYGQGSEQVIKIGGIVGFKSGKEPVIDARIDVMALGNRCIATAFSDKDGVFLVTFSKSAFSQSATQTAPNIIQSANSATQSTQSSTQQSNIQSSQSGIQSTHSNTQSTQINTQAAQSDTQAVQGITQSVKSNTITLKITGISIKDHSKVIKLSSKSIINLGYIFVEPGNLEAAVVTADSHIRPTLDGYMYDVASDTLSQKKKINNIISRLPFIDLDINNKPTYFGIKPTYIS